VENCTSKHFTKVLSREMPLKNNKTRFFVLYSDRARFQPVRVLAVSSLYLTSVKRDLLSTHTIQLTWTYIHQHTRKESHTSHNSVLIHRSETCTRNCLSRNYTSTLIESLKAREYEICLEFCEFKYVQVCSVISFIPIPQYEQSNAAVF